MLSRRLLTILVTAIAVVAYFVFFDQRENLAYLFIPLLIGVAIVYTSKDYLDYWSAGLKKYRLPKGMQQFLRQHITGYADLSTEDRAIFDSYVFRFSRFWTFMPNGFDEVSEMSKGVIAAHVARVAFLWKDKGYKLVDKVNNVVIYKHPFPTPEINALHLSELNLEDNGAIFCEDAYMKAHLYPDQFFNTPVYEYAKVLLKERPLVLSEEDVVDAAPYDFNDLLVFMNLTAEQMNPAAVAIHHCMQYPEIVKEHAPKTWKSFEEWSSAY